jgi:hypothetical protein
VYIAGSPHIPGALAAATMRRWALQVGVPFTCQRTNLASGAYGDVAANMRAWVRTGVVADARTHLIKGGIA